MAAPSRSQPERRDPAHGFCGGGASRAPACGNSLSPRDRSCKQDLPPGPWPRLLVEKRNRPRRRDPSSAHGERGEKRLFARVTYALPTRPRSQTRPAPPKRSSESAAAEVERLTKLRDAAEKGSAEHRELCHSRVGRRVIPRPCAGSARRSRRHASRPEFPLRERGARRAAGSRVSRDSPRARRSSRASLVRLCAFQRTPLVVQRRDNEPGQHTGSLSLPTVKRAASG